MHICCAMHVAQKRLSSSSIHVDTCTKEMCLSPPTGGLAVTSQSLSEFTPVSSFVILSGCTHFNAKHEQGPWPSLCVPKRRFTYVLMYCHVKRRVKKGVPCRLPNIACDQLQRHLGRYDCNRYCEGNVEGSTQTTVLATVILF